MKSGNRSAHVTLEGITKRYGAAVAADSISLEIEEKEFVTLLGPSGSGKTTTLMIVAGFVYPDSGRLAIEGRDITHIPPFRRNIGMVFQNYALFPHMSVFENIAYPLKMRYMPRKKIRTMVDEALEVVQLRGLSHRRPAQLSGGQQQRVAFARALVFHPRILLMDEPLGALDKKLREHMQLELKHVHEKLGITILYVTHDQEEALTMSTRIAIMNHGCIEQIGSAIEIYDRPVNDFVADFVGEINFFPADVTQAADKRVVLESCLGSIETDVCRRYHCGQQVHIAVRPERITFVTPGCGSYRSYPGIVEDIVYLGDITKYYIRLSEIHGTRMNKPVSMKVQNRHGNRRYNRGDHVHIGWDVKDAILV